ncbi:MAG: hypothetical protein D6759_18720 [Chloroflexi bacterium]|nr:MAG: hypothetical protein D6759_18720 [Chloroflexota bacterium]
MKLLNAQIDETQRQLLQALWEKGPAMPLELAVRTFMLPDEIQQPLQELEKAGLVERHAFKGGEMLVLTKLGQEIVRS